MTHVAFGTSRFLLSSNVVVLVSPCVSERVGQMGGSSGVSTTNGALLEVTLEDVTSRERIAAQNTHVRSITSVA